MIDMNLEIIIGKNVRRLRRKKKWSQDTLADRYGCIKPYISQIENGKTWIGKDVFYKLCKILEAEPEDLIFVDVDIPLKTLNTIENIINSQYADVLQLVIAVLSLADLVDQSDLAEIHGELKIIHRQILRKIK
jgi:transcriptional regulator with XRE-family HTH domain